MRKGYITIPEWMLELPIKRYHLMTFAIIYSFSQDGQSYFKGTAQYIAEWIGCSKVWVLKILRELRDKELIQERRRKELNGAVYVDYRARLDTVEKMLGNPGKETLPSPVNSVTYPGKETLPSPVNSVYPNNSNNKSIDISFFSRTREGKKEKNIFYKTFFFNNVNDPEKEVRIFLTHYCDCGWKTATGDPIKNRVSLAWKWKPQTGSGRFKDPFLDFWSEVYSVMADIDEMMPLTDIASARVNDSERVLTVNVSQRLMEAMEAEVQRGESSRIRHAFRKYYPNYQFKYSQNNEQ